MHNQTIGVPSVTLNAAFMCTSRETNSLVIKLGKGPYNER